MARIKWVFAVFLCVCVLPATTLARQSNPQKKLYAFVNVNVIPMDREQVLENQVVLVKNGKISKIGPANQVKIPKKAERIEAGGKFLLPGLIDAHAHLASDTNLPNDLARQWLKLNLANGITTIRNMVGNPSHLVLRDRIARGEALGPTLITSGPPILGFMAPNPAEGEQLVTEYKNAGFDLIKVHENLSPQTYDAIVATARKLGIPVAGHVTQTVGLERALNARQETIEHLDGYIRALLPTSVPVQVPPGQIILGPVLQYVETARIPALAQTTKTAGVYNTPTLALFKVIVSDEKPEDLLKWPELRYATPKMRSDFTKQKQSFLNNAIPLEDRLPFTQIRNQLVVGLAQNGAKLLAGSDSPQFFLVPGFALHRELQALVDAGLTPFQALEAATRTPAEYLKLNKQIGTIEVGKRADLVLVDANPLTSIANASKTAGVMLRGQWISGAELQRMLAEIAELNK